MAKALMGRTKFKIQRRLGLELPGLGRPGAIERRPYAPGVHGAKRKKLSDYTIRLMEKQKIIFHYGVREKQLVNYVRKAKKRKDMPWVEALIITLESRLDNIIFRLNFAPSMAAARQLITHRHVLVNGKRCTIPSQVLTPNDKITLSTKGFQSGNYLQAKQKPRMVPPAYLRKENESGNEVGQLVTHPQALDIPFTFNNQLLTEFYWKI